MSKLMTRRNAAILVFGLLIVAVAARSLLNPPADQDMGLSPDASVKAERAAKPLPGPETEPIVMLAEVDANRHPPRLLSAFFGLDNSLPFGANRLCLGAFGKDGMPVVFSHTIDPATLQSEDFQIVTQSGTVSAPLCVTLRPATDPGEGRTVLLIGEFGDAPDDPPVSVRVVGDLLSDGVPVSFRGLHTDVIPLDAGPSLVHAEIVPESEWTRKTRGTACPADIQQVVRVTWTGGVRLPNGNEPGDLERGLYRVTVKHEDGSSDEISPAALAELEDGDNNHFLCLDTSDRAVSVSFPAGHLVDPNKDLNPDTHIALNRVVKEDKPK